MEVGDPDERAVDSTTALQKVLRLDRKHTNFDYYDPIRHTTIHVSYPQTAPEGPSSEILLKSLWQHLTNYYFKPIQAQEIERIDFLKRVLNTQNEGNYRFEAGQDFWETIQGMFSGRLLTRYMESQRKRIHHHNWLQTLFLNWKMAQMTDAKRQRKRAVELASAKKSISLMADVQQDQQVKLDHEREILGGLLGEDETDGDELGDQIQRLEEEMRLNNGEVWDILGKVQGRVRDEILVQEMLYCEGEADIEPRDIHELTRIERKLARMDKQQVQVDFIEYTIEELEKKQIAESVAKLTRLQKSKGDVKIQLVFQGAMGLRSQIVTEQQFLAINELREYSLLKFYNTASKSRYSFVCQNDMFERRTEPCRLKNLDILSEMKRGPLDPMTAPFNRQFSRMDLCHQCKLLHPESALVRCEYRSHRCGSPVPASPYYDSYVHQIVKNEQSKTMAIRQINNQQLRQNSWFYYVQEGQQYVCGRKYCRYCLKNYEDGKEKAGGLCPYCRGICYCTRCSRNDVMVRLKSMLIVLGGDIYKVQKQSLFEQYYHENGEEQPNLRHKEKGKNSRKNLLQIQRGNEKMINIRYQLEDLRMICDLVKRREKNKQKLINCERETFRSKVRSLGGDWLLQQRKERERPSPEPQPAPKLTEKMSKKLKRMIS